MSNLSNRVRLLGKRAGIEDLRPHALRRACATHMVEAGLSLRVVQIVLGHSSLERTARYVGVSASQLQRAVARLDVVPAA